MIDVKTLIVVTISSLAVAYYLVFFVMSMDIIKTKKEFLISFIPFGGWVIMAIQKWKTLK